MTTNHENKLQSGSGAISEPQTQTQTAQPSTLGAPANRKYHDQDPLTRNLLAASAGEKDISTTGRAPNFYPAEWPVGAVILYLVLLVAGIYSGVILWTLTSLSGNPLLAVVAPGLIGIVEFVVIAGIKYRSLRDKQIAQMKAFVAEDRAARDAALHAATAWCFKDWLVLVILLVCFAAKAFVLIEFGAFQPLALLATNWTIALLDLCFHLAGTTTRVPCFVGSRLVDRVHLSRRHSKGYGVMGADGKSALGSLVERPFQFISAVPLWTGEVDGHRIVHTGTNAAGHHHSIYCAGTLDDSDRAAFLQYQPSNAAKDELARALARVQLELLMVPEMRSLNFNHTPLPTPPAGPSDPPLNPVTT